jgi:hypothetical protein
MPMKEKEKMQKKSLDCNNVIDNRIIYLVEVQSGFAMTMMTKKEIMKLVMKEALLQ